MPDMGRATPKLIIACGAALSIALWANISIGSDKVTERAAIAGLWGLDAVRSREDMRKHYDDWIITTGFRSLGRSFIIFEPKMGAAIYMKDRDTVDFICRYEVAAQGAIENDHCEHEDGSAVDPDKHGRLTLRDGSIQITDGHKYSVWFRRIGKVETGS